MSDYLSNGQIRQIMVRHKVDQQMLPEYLPPEAQDGRGADHNTELLGFKRDFDVYIQRALDKFPRGATRDELAAHLTEQAEAQGQTSAGPYLRATLLEVRDVIAPGFGKQAVPEAPHPALDAAAAVAALKQAHPDRDSWDVIDVASSKLPKEGATAAHLASALRHSGDLYQEMGDDYLAETADILHGTLTVIQAEHAQAHKPSPAARQTPPRP